MDYDKNSFLAGMSVGMTMKGWACGSAQFGLGGTVIRAGTYPPISNWTGAALTSGVITGEFEVEE